jgi:hypothetical protein
MANAALFIGWNRPVPGREAQALESFQAFMNYLGKCQTEKKIESFEPVIIEAHGGDLNGFCLVRGDRNQLHTLRGSDEWQKLWMQGTWTMNQLGVTEAFIGEGMQTRMAQIAKLIQQNR